MIKAIFREVRNRLWKGRHRAVGSPNDIALTLLEASIAIVGGTSKAIEEHLDVRHRSQLPKVKLELYFFHWFSITYWLQDVLSTQERRPITEALCYHWREGFGSDLKGQVALDTIQERFNAYGQIVNEGKTDIAMFYDFGKKLSEYCGMPGYPDLLVLAPFLFKEALESLSVALRIRRTAVQDKPDLV